MTLVFADGFHREGFVGFEKVGFVGMEREGFRVEQGRSEEEEERHWRFEGEREGGSLKCLIFFLLGWGLVQMGLASSAEIFPAKLCGSFNLDRSF